MATPTEIVTTLVGNVPKMVQQFTDVAQQDPLSAVSLAFGALFVVGASVVLGLLAAGAALDLLGASPGSPR